MSMIKHKNYAEKLFLKCLKYRKNILGLSHYDTLITMINLLTTYGFQSKFDELEKLASECNEINNSLHPPYIFITTKIDSYLQYIRNDSNLSSINEIETNLNNLVVTECDVSNKKNV